MSRQASPKPKTERKPLTVEDRQRHLAHMMRIGWRLTDPLVRKYIRVHRLEQFAQKPLHELIAFASTATTDQ